MIRKYIIVADDSIKGFDEGIAKLEREWGAEEIETSEDCISREDAVKIASINSMPVYECVKMIKALPSVTPQPTIGKWINVDSLDGALWHACSECGETEFYATDYCPNCGAKMEVEE